MGWGVTGGACVAVTTNESYSWVTVEAAMEVEAGVAVRWGGAIAGSWGVGRRVCVQVWKSSQRLEG